MDRRLLLAALTAGALYAPARADERIVLLYNKHAAYHSDPGGNGSVKGLIATPVKQAFKAAGIAYTWRELPVARQRDALVRNAEPACVVGANKIAERERVGKFSHPVYRGLPIVALSLADNAAMVNGRPLHQTLDDRRLVLLAKDGYTFGPFVAAALARAQPRTEHTVAEVPNMLQMLLHKRADYFFMAEDAFAPLVENSGERLALFKVSHFSDMPAGNLRYLWCTAQVPDAALNKLNVEFDKIMKSK